MAAYQRWGTADDILVMLTLVDPTQLGATGKIPEVAIRRIRALPAGPNLDGWYWNGTTFVPTPTWIIMAEVDAVQNPGLYQYLFEQSLVASSWLYYIYFRHLSEPIGFDAELHAVTDELFIPSASPVVPVSPTDTVMGRLAAMEDPSTAVPQAISDAAWDEPLMAHAIPGSTGEALGKWTFGWAGARQIDITVQTAGAVAIPNAQVDVYNYNNTVFLGRKYTDSNGEVSLALDDGSYNIRMVCAGYAFTVPEVLLVTADAAVAYIGTSVINIVPPPDPSLCAVYGVVRTSTGQPLVGACVCTWAKTPQAVAGAQQGNPINSTQTDTNGFFQINLERGLVVRFQIENTDVDWERTVPNAVQQDITTWKA
jgi:hypothetical protein